MVLAGRFQARRKVKSLTRFLTRDHGMIQSSCIRKAIPPLFATFLSPGSTFTRAARRMERGPFSWPAWQRLGLPLSSRSKLSPRAPAESFTRPCGRYISLVTIIRTSTVTGCKYKAPLPPRCTAQTANSQPLRQASNGIRPARVDVTEEAPRSKRAAVHPCDLIAYPVNQHPTAETRPTLGRAFPAFAHSQLPIQALSPI